MLNVYKLTNGEDVIGDVIEEAETGVFLENPVSYVTMPNHGFQMKDWLMLVKDNSVFLDHRHIMLDLGAPNDFGAYCYESFISHRKIQKDYLEKSLNDDPLPKLDHSEMSEDIKEIFASLQLLDKKQIN